MSKKSSKKIIPILLVSLLVISGGAFSAKTISDNVPDGGTVVVTPPINNDGTPTSIIINETPIVF